MTQAELFPPLCLRDRVASVLMDAPNQWIDGMALAKVGGAYAWRTRLSECRTQLGMQIENRVRRVGKRAISEYRLVKEVQS